MSPTTARIHNAAITAFSLVCAYTLAFWWQLDKPFWAGFTVFMVSLPSIGQSLQKGVLRTFGTILGACAALVLLMVLHQERMLLLFGLSSYLCLMLVLMHIDENYAYFFFISAVVTLVIVLMSVQDPLHAFQLAVYRTEETLLGIGVYTLVTLIISPKSSEDSLYQHLRSLRQTHQRMNAALDGDPALRIDRESLRRVYELYASIQEENSAARLLLPAVGLERYQIYRDRHVWRNALSCSVALAEAQREWSGVLAMLCGIDGGSGSVSDMRIEGGSFSEGGTIADSVFRDFPEKMALLAEACSALAGEVPAISLSGESPEAFPTIEVQPEAFAQLGPSEKSVVLSAQKIYQRQLFLCQRLRGLTAYLLDGAPLPRLHKELPRPHPFFSPEQRQNAFAVCVIFWCTACVWLLFDPPGTGDARFLEMTVLFGLTALFVGKQTYPVLLLFLFLGVLFTGFMYVFIYPAMTDVVTFMIVLFLVSFCIMYLFPTKQQGSMKLGIMLPWLALCQFSNTPVYDFAAFANGAFSILLAGGLILLVHYLFLYSDAETNFIRAQRMFFRAITSVFVFIDKRRSGTLTVCGRLYLSLLQRHVTFTAEKLRYAAGSCPLFEPDLARLISAESFDIAVHVRSLSDTVVAFSGLGTFMAHLALTPSAPRIAAQSDVVRSITRSLLESLHQAGHLSPADLEKSSSLCGSLLKAISTYAAVVREVPWPDDAQRTL